MNVVIRTPEGVYDFQVLAVEVGAVFQGFTGSVAEALPSPFVPVGTTAKAAPAVIAPAPAPVPLAPTVEATNPATAAPLQATATPPPVPAASPAAGNPGAAVQAPPRGDCLVCGKPATRYFMDEKGSVLGGVCTLEHAEQAAKLQNDHDVQSRGAMPG